jgi:hypothetical protein
MNRSHFYHRNMDRIWSDAPTIKPMPAPFPWRKWTLYAAVVAAVCGVGWAIEWGLGL